MTKKTTVVLMLFCFFSCSFVTGVSADEVLMPENYFQEITLQPVITKLIEDDDPEDALYKLNLLHGQMAEDGWEFLELVEFYDSGDFEGFFVTYKKQTSQTTQIYQE